jgi:hypothetical protein
MTKQYHFKRNRKPGFDEFLKTFRFSTRKNVDEQDARKMYDIMYRAKIWRYIRLAIRIAAVAIAAALMLLMFWFALCVAFIIDGDYMQ